MNLQTKDILFTTFSSLGLNKVIYTFILTKFVNKKILSNKFNYADKCSCLD